MEDSIDLMKEAGFNMVRLGHLCWDIYEPEDVAGPAYQYYALRFAKVLTEWYNEHPALFGFWLCNEIRDRFRSYGELNNFQDVVFQENDLAVGAPECWHRIWGFRQDRSQRTSTSM